MTFIACHKCGNYSMKVGSLDDGCTQCYASLEDKATPSPAVGADALEDARARQERSDKWFDEVCRRLVTAAGGDWSSLDEPSIEDMEAAIRDGRVGGDTPIDPHLELAKEMALRIQHEGALQSAAEQLAAKDAEIDALKAQLAEREHDMHIRIRAGYDQTVADSWKAHCAKIEAERDEARKQLDELSMLRDRMSEMIVVDCQALACTEPVKKAFEDLRKQLAEKEAQRASYADIAAAEMDKATDLRKQLAAKEVELTSAKEIRDLSLASINLLSSSLGTLIQAENPGCAMSSLVGGRMAQLSVAFERLLKQRATTGKGVES